MNHVRSKECQTKKNETGLYAHIKKEKLRQNVAIFIRLTCRAIIILSVNHALKKNPDENMSFVIIAGQATRNSPIIWAAFICCCSPWWWMEWLPKTSRPWGDQQRKRSKYKRDPEMSDVVIAGEKRIRLKTCFPSFVGIKGIKSKSKQNEPGSWQNKIQAEKDLIVYNIHTRQEQQCRLPLEPLARAPIAHFPS